MIGLDIASTFMLCRGMARRVNESAATSGATLERLLVTLSSVSPEALRGAAILAACVSRFKEVVEILVWFLPLSGMPGSRSFFVAVLFRAFEDAPLPGGFKANLYAAVISASEEVRGSS